MFWLPAESQDALDILTLLCSYDALERQTNDKVNMSSTENNADPLEAIICHCHYFDL